MLFDFILNTFASGGDQPPPSKPTDEAAPTTVDQPAPRQPGDKLRVRVKLTSVVLVLNDDGDRLATLSLSAADVTVILNGPTMRVTARLGNVGLADDVEDERTLPQFRQLLAIEGSELAEFVYETFDEHDRATYPGHDTLIYLRTGSLRFTLVEQPVHRLLRFLTRFARMKAVLDAARAAAASQAAGLQERVSRMHYDVLIRTPIIVFPRAVDSADVIVANLGEISLSNRFDAGGDTLISAGLRQIKLTSEFEGDPSHVQIIEDVELTAEVTTATAPIDRATELSRPDTLIRAELSSIRMSLTSRQFAFLLSLGSSIPRIFSTTEAEQRADADAEAGVPAEVKAHEQPEKDAAKEEENGGGPTADLYPELPRTATAADGQTVKLWPTLEFGLAFKGVVLELFLDPTERDHDRGLSLARFALTQTSVRLKQLSNGATEAELGIKSVTIADTHASRSTRYREIMPASKHAEQQIILSYAASGGVDGSSVANLTVDSPTIIFSLEPLFRLSSFVSGALAASKPDNGEEDETDEPAPVASSSAAVPKDAAATTAESGGEGGMAMRINVSTPKIMLLADPDRVDTEAIVLSIDRVQMSQQHTTALAVTKLGMFFVRMNAQSDRLRVLDDLDLSVSMDTRAHGTGRSTVTAIEVMVQAVVLRISYRDVLLAQHTLNRAIELSQRAESQQANADQQRVQRRRSSRRAPPSSSRGPGKSGKAPPPPPPTTTTTHSRGGSSQIVVAKETLKASFDGFQLVLISDIHELPVIDLVASKFMIRASDWSSDVRPPSARGQR